MRLSAAKIILAHTYHLDLRPGHGLIRKLGRTAQVQAWNGRDFADSGGYQVFRPDPNWRKITV